MTMLIPATFSALMGLAFTACTPAADGNGNIVAATTSNQPSANTVDNTEEEGIYAKIQTSKGTMVLVFRADKAPNHVKNFVDLARKGVPAIPPKQILASATLPSCRRIQKPAHTAETS